MDVLFKLLLAACICYGAVYHLWENDQDYKFAVLCNINLLYDNITGYKLSSYF